MKPPVPGKDFTSHGLGPGTLRTLSSYHVFSIYPQYNGCRAKLLLKTPQLK